MAFGHTGKKAVSDRHRKDLGSRVRARGPKSTGQATCPISFKLLPVVLHRANTAAEVAASQQGVLSKLKLQDFVGPQCAGLRETESRKKRCTRRHNG